MSLSDKILRRDNQKNPYYFLHASDVREAVRELKERLKELAGSRDIQQIDIWIDEIFGEKLK